MSAPAVLQDMELQLVQSCRVGMELVWFAASGKAFDTVSHNILPGFAQPRLPQPRSVSCGEKVTLLSRRRRRPELPQHLTLFLGVKVVLVLHGLCGAAVDLPIEEMF